MISTSGILSTGEKKWMPMKLSGRFEASASPVIGSVEVLEAKIARLGDHRLGLLGDPRLMSRSSNTASITRSQPSRSA
jgi:hypothetical protein